MKKILLFVVFAGIVPSILADTCYDLANDILFSEPESANINPYVYCSLYLQFFSVLSKTMFHGKPLIDVMHSVMMKEAGAPSSLSSEYCQQAKDERDRVLEYFYEYLQSIGSPEALRLVSDLKRQRIISKNYRKHNAHKILLSNGNFALADLGIKYKVCKNLKKFKKPNNL